ncbi:Sodium/potassium-transporting ATPase subunit beta family-containing protein [Strongyloides ratti]|uniref:Sodium/potassium-transporting ATPase subunit beta family-containing protein n=1 Tax=Strongyloides ratti TaxID=34506 RepID=A0A090LGU9_STRRB|nr:Sodium/potassium-transporting ATPase subunit beta family-containing protein [Strongyloides ratti]CEF69012.1 Sodium/potassium-transporting ATPase subunit beta family-containing protein [Strongyloides ratti]
MSLRQLSQNSSISKNVTTKVDNEKNSLLNSNNTKSTLTSITHTQETEIYNDPVLQNNKGIPFTKEDQKRFLKESNKKKVFTIAYLGKCIIFYCTLYSIYALLGISIMYIFMLGSWNSDVPTLTGKGSFIGVPGINMIPKLEGKRENPTIKYNITDNTSYIKYTSFIMQFFAKIHNASQFVNERQHNKDQKLDSNYESKDVFKNRNKREEDDDEISDELNTNFSINNDNKSFNNQSMINDKKILNIENEKNTSTVIAKEEKNNVKVNVNQIDNIDKEISDETNELTETLFNEKHINLTNEDSLNNNLINNKTVEKSNTTTNLTSTVPEKNNKTDIHLIPTENLKNDSEHNETKVYIEETLHDKKDNSFNCSHENDYGYAVGEPCIIIYLNNVLMWKKPVFNISNIPSNYQQNVHNFINETSLEYIIPVSCQLKGKEKESQKYFSYLFPGIIDQNGYYPVTKNSNILKKPYMMLQLKNIPKNENIQITCRYYVNEEISIFEEEAMTLKFNVNISQ